MIPNSPGAGNIVYRLVVRNHTSKACTLADPSLRLLGATGSALPTHPIWRAPAQRIAVAARTTVAATARFSPDVPGVGETQMGACEPVAHRLQLAPKGGGRLDAAIAPATSVCEHGQLSLSVFGHTG